MLQRAELYYNKVAAHIGYSRYQDFWTWDERVKIVVYANQSVFTKETGLPPWSKGGAIHEKRFFKSRAIITFKQEQGFLDGFLPHEIAHLIFKDFTGNRSDIPLWFEEGIAQLQERGKKEAANQMLKKFVAKDYYFSAEGLYRADIRHEMNSVKVAIFYAQSVSMVDFLISKYGSESFMTLCSHLKRGKSLKKAIILAYQPSINSLSEFEKRWLAAMSQ